VIAKGEFMQIPVNSENSGWNSGIPVDSGGIHGGIISIDSTRNPGGKMESMWKWDGIYVKDSM